MVSLPSSDAPPSGPAQPIPLQNRKATLLRRIYSGAFNALWILFVLFTGLILALRYAILPNIDHYRPDLEAAASQILHQRVTIGAVSSSWQGLRPRLSLSALEVYDNSGAVALRLPEVDATLAWESLAVFQLRLYSLEFGAPDLEIRRDDDKHLLIGGIPVNLDDQSGGSSLVDWLLSQHQVIVRDARILWRDQVRAAPDLTLDNINIVLEHFGTRHRFAVSATPDPELAAPIDLRGVFDHALFARDADTARWGGEVYVALDRVDLAAWHPYFDYPVELTHGSGALRAWLHFAPLATHNGRATRLPELTADVRLTDLVARLAPTLPLLSITAVDGRLGLRETVDGDELVLHSFSVLGADGLDLPTTDLLARRSLDANGAVTGGNLSSDRLDLDTLADLLHRVPLSKAARDVLDTLRPRGELRHLSVSWRGTPDNPRTYDVAGDLLGFSIASLDLKGGGPGNPAPGFTNISGHVRATEHDGTLTLASHALALTLPGVFDSAQTALQRLEGEVDWTVSGSDLEVRVPTLRFENADASGTAQVLYRHGPRSGSSGPGYLELTGHFSRVDARRVVAYLPASLHADIKRYLERAILTGNSDDTSFRVRGALERFPFRDAGAAGSKPGAMHDVANSLLGASAEEFRVDARLNDVRYDYSPRPGGAPGGEPLWPVMTLAHAELSVDRTRMEISSTSAKVYDFALTNVRATLPDLDDHNQIMQIQGEGAGPLGDLLRFVNASPVTNWIGHFAEGTAATGNARLTLSIAMPFAHMDDTRVNGAVQMQGNELTLFPWLPPIARTTGRLEFSDDGIALHDVSGDLLGGNLKLSGNTHDDHVIEILGEGTVAPAAWRRMPGWPALARIGERLDGSARYSLAVHVPGRSTDEKSAAARQPRVVIDTTLAGIAIDLPEPMHKSAAETMPLHFEMSAPAGKARDASDELRVRIGPGLSAILQRRPDEHGQMQVAQVAYGINEPAALSEGHTSLAMTLKRLDADAWQKGFAGLIGDTSATLSTPGSAAAPYLPDLISAHVDALRYWDKQLDNVVVSALRNNQAWQVNVTSDQVAGRVAWRQGGATGVQQNRVTARLARLVIPQSAAREVDTLLDSSASDIPALDIIADNFELNQKKFGHLELQASNVTTSGRHEWHLDKLNLANPDGTLDAQGSWGAESAAPGSPVRTRLGFTVNSANVGGLLDRLGIKGAIDHGSATLKGDINWRGSPLSFDYSSLAGTLRLDASKGQFLKADPGVAKLLGVLSLQSLARRLSFDYSDIFGSGFAFDSIDANVAIADGVAATKDFAMKGPSAVVGIEGSADLARETQNLHVVFVPRVNTSAASIFLLATPVTALGALLFSQVLEGPLSNMFKVEYNVTGPWIAPVFTKIERRAPASGAPSAEPAPPGAARSGNARPDAVNADPA